LGGDLQTKGESVAGERRATDPAAPPLARRPDFQLGSALVRPSIRTIEGPDGNVTTEPRVMQVLLAFVDAGGAVLARDDLLRSCWNGAIVGDDSINRAVAEVRRISRETGAGFGIETIPRIGYRLTGVTASGSSPATQPAQPADPVKSEPAKPSRRWILGGAIAAVGVAAIGVRMALKPRIDPRFTELMDLGNKSLRMGLAAASAKGVEYFEQAVALYPDNAEAWGLLALARGYVVDGIAAQGAGIAVEESEQAARRALALDPREPNALTALALLQRKLDDWFTTDRKLRDVLAIAPDNMAASSQLVAILQAGGYYKESWDLNEKAIAIDPLRPGLQYRRAFKLWIMGRPVEADQVIARALELWPTHPQVWNARLIISAFTGQTQSARALIHDKSVASQMIAPISVAIWEKSLTALDTRSASDVALARTANLAAAAQSTGIAVHAIMILAELGEVDAAYSVIDGLLLRRGQLATRSTPEGGMSPASDPLWRQTQWLFTPATMSVRADPRFNALCDAIGLSEYWRMRGIPPDEGLPKA
jgi:DNA-binding winged helix-turn-helix (wHTH) protein/tetratricopeptide (TPR) repeat protein